MRVPPAQQVAVLGLVVLAAGCARVPPFPPPTVANTVQVTINVTCTADEVSFSLSPWTARVSEGGSVDWVIAQNAATTSIEVTRKQGTSGWPFVHEGPYRGSKAEPARAGRMKGNPAKNRPHPYQVELTCVPATGAPHLVVIDPDIVVD